MSKKKKSFSDIIKTYYPVLLVTVIALICGIVSFFIQENQFEEIPTNDKTVVDLHKKYFRSEDVCLDYNIKLFVDGTISVKNMSYEDKEKVAIDYASRKGYDKIGFNELGEVYSFLFNDGSSLIEKNYYESTSGTYRKDGDIYVLDGYSKCSTFMPVESVCLIINKAYKSKHNIKVVVGVVSGTANDRYLYSGLDWDTEPLGLYGEFDPAEKDLAQWEIVYRYDDKLGHYFLDYTKKL